METLREDQVWVSAWQALEPFSWCKNRAAMELLSEWLDVLIERQVLSKCLAARIEKLLVVKLVSQVFVKTYAQALTAVVTIMAVRCLPLRPMD